MLQLNYPAAVGLYIGNVLLTIVSCLDDFLPTTGKFILPRSVPYAFVFPPRIAGTPCHMSPVPGIYFPALRDHRACTNWACASKAGLGLPAFFVHDREFHVRLVLSLISVSL
jgi:hypothetical protein